MKQLSRVVWSEGMHLAPHHFQVQARYFEDAVHFTTSALHYASYGFAGAELDAEALQNGTVAVTHARGLFPDGLPFHMPESDPLPAPRSITDLFSPVKERLTVFLGIPRYRPEAVNFAPAGAPASEITTRYAAAAQLMHDENTGLDDKPIELGRKNIRILLEDEINEDIVALPVARVMRDGAGHFIYDDQFVPPCLRLSANQRLMLILRRLIEILEEKSSLLARTKHDSGGMATAFSQREVSSFWFLHCVNSGLAALRNLYLTKRGHPEEAFVELSRLAGALCTFGLESHPAKLPLYNHDRLEQCFGDLDEHIRFHLESVIPTNCITIPLAPGEDYYYTAEIGDQRCLGRSRWIFSIRAKMGEADLIAAVPALVKICSLEFITKLVQRALPGLTLTHMSVPPTAVSPRVDHQYFTVTKAGPCWDHIVHTRQVGVYVPEELPDPEITLNVILES